MKLNHVCFCYFGQIITAAFQIVRKVQGSYIHNEIEVSFAYCSPLDNFSKRKGRDLATKRLTALGSGKIRNKRGGHDPARWSKDINIDENPVDVVSDIFNHVVPKHCKPQWCSSLHLINGVKRKVK